MTSVGELRREYGALTSDDVAALDRAAVESGVSVVQLMEIAGWQLARCAWNLLHEQPARVLVLAGRGNNGGDGLVAARHLATWGCDVVARVFRKEEDLSVMLAGQVRSRLQSPPCRDTTGSARIRASLPRPLQDRA